jgi:hypothetical protein
MRKRRKPRVKPHDFMTRSHAKIRLTTFWRRKKTRVNRRTMYWLKRAGYLR